MIGSAAAGAAKLTAVTGASLQSRITKSEQEPYCGSDLLLLSLNVGRKMALLRVGVILISGRYI